MIPCILGPIMETVFLSIAQPRTITDANFVKRRPGVLPIRGLFRPDQHFLYYQWECERIMEDRDGSFPLRPGDVILFTAGHEYVSYRAVHGYRAMNVLFEPAPGDRTQRGAHALSAPDHEIAVASRTETGLEPRIRQLFEEIVWLSHGTTRLRRLKAAALLTELLIELAMLAAPERADAGSIVEYTIDRLERNPSGRLDIDELARTVGTSRRTLTRRFRQATGKSIQQYQLDLRLRLATSILRTNPTITVREVADTLGFYDEFHFSRTFKQHLGKSPSAYRRQEDIPTSHPNPASSTGPTEFFRLR